MVWNIFCIYFCNISVDCVFRRLIVAISLLGIFIPFGSIQTFATGLFESLANSPNTGKEVYKSKVSFTFIIFLCRYLSGNHIHKSVSYETFWFYSSVKPAMNSALIDL